MEPTFLHWVTILGSIIAPSISYTSPEVKYEFDPEEHPNWKKLEHEDCGFSLRDRIVGGKDAKLGQYPWLARVGRMRESIFSIYFSFSCGGTIISKNYIITAAHCFAQKNNLPNVIRVGEYDTSTDPDCIDDFCAPKVQTIKIRECYFPPKKEQNIFENDLAMCLLDETIQYNDVVGPICLQPKNISQKDWTGQIAEVAGWGLLDPVRENTPNILQFLQIPIVNDYACGRFKRMHKNYPFNILCAGGKRGEDSCAGDSGGPLMMPLSTEGSRKYYLIGVVSYGPEMCGASSVPAVYTDISQFQPWILDLIKN